MWTALHLSILCWHWVYIIIIHNNSYCRTCTHTHPHTHTHTHTHTHAHTHIHTHTAKATFIFIYVLCPVQWISSICHCFITQKLSSTLISVFETIFIYTYVVMIMMIHQTHWSTLCSIKLQLTNIHYTNTCTNLSNHLSFLVKLFDNVRCFKIFPFILAWCTCLFTMVWTCIHVLRMSVVKTKSGPSGDTTTQEHKG